MNWGEAFARVPSLLASHVLIAFAALALGLIIALPGGVFAARHKRFGRVALGFASLVQTIPSLALLALFYPLLLIVSRATGDGFSPLGFLPALFALTLYALLPILRNTVVALQGIDPDIIDAADGMGMTGWQKLTLVEVPLALPGVMAGVRTAAIWTIGAATLATTVGQPSLGDIIFSGLQTQNWVLVLAGCLAAAALALGVDALLAIGEHGVVRRRKGTALVALALLLAMPVAAAVQGHRADRKVVTIGAKSFSESYILARLIGGRLAKAGYTVRYRENLGSAVVFRALAAGDVDVYVDYAGTIWANQMGRRDIVPRAEMDRGVAAWVRRHGVVSFGSLGFENAYALAMRQDLARRSNIASLADLTRRAPELTLGGDLEFLDRPEWAALKNAYSLNFGKTRSFAPSFMYDALKSGDADVISAFSSDGRIVADRLRVLTDPKGALPGYDALLLVNANAARDRRFAAPLRGLADAISVEDMRRANFMVDGTKSDPQAAADWLESRIAARGAR